MTLALALSLAAQLCFFAAWFAVSGRPPFPVTIVLLGLSALAMGFQTAAVFSLGILGVFTTAATATLTMLTGDTAHSSSTRPDRQLLASVLLALITGAALGGLLVRDARAYAPLHPLVVTASVVLTAESAFRGGRGGGRRDRHERRTEDRAGPRRLAADCKVALVGRSPRARPQLHLRPRG